MAISTSARLAHYEIIAPLGAGGMGEVYLAQDTRLARKVALKLLPAEFTKDAERVRRFEQEAKTASALNQPHSTTLQTPPPSSRLIPDIPAALILRMLEKEAYARPNAAEVEILLNEALMPTESIFVFLRIASWMII